MSGYFENFSLIGAILLAINLAAIAFALLSIRRDESTRANMHLSDDVIKGLCYKTVFADLDKNTYQVNVKLGDNTKAIKPDFDQFIGREAGKIADAAGNADFFMKFNRDELLKAFRNGNGPVEGEYTLNDIKGRSHRIVVRALMYEYGKSGVRALLTFRELIPSKREIALGRKFISQTKQMEKMKEEAAAISSLLEEKVLQINELEEELNALSDEYAAVLAKDNRNAKKWGDRYSDSDNETVCDVRTTVKGLLPEIQKLAEEAQVDFALKIMNIESALVFCEPATVNDLILEMLSGAMQYCDKGGKVIFCISQMSDEDTYGLYEYSCVYLGKGLVFNSKTAEKLGARVELERSEDGATVISVRVVFDTYHASKETAEAGEAAAE